MGVRLSIGDWGTYHSHTTEEKKKHSPSSIATPLVVVRLEVPTRIHAIMLIDLVMCSQFFLTPVSPIYNRKELVVSSFMH